MMLLDVFITAEAKAAVAAVDLVVFASAAACTTEVRDAAANGEGARGALAAFGWTAGAATRPPAGGGTGGGRGRLAAFGWTAGAATRPPHAGGTGGGRGTPAAFG
jgi:hypothetical protein